MDANRRLAELLEIPWHEVNTRARSRKCSCGLRFNTGYDLTIHVERNYKDFAADPRLVLREMIQRNDWFAFVTFLGNFSQDGISYDVAYDVAEIINTYILDTTGQLRDRAVLWMEGKGAKK